MVAVYTDTFSQDDTQDVHVLASQQSATRERVPDTQGPPEWDMPPFAFEPIDYATLPAPLPIEQSPESITYAKRQQVGTIYYLCASFPEYDLIDGDQSARDAWEHARSIWDDRTYTGWTLALDARVEKHNRGTAGVKYTAELVKVYGGAWVLEAHWLGTRDDERRAKTQGTPRLIARYFCRYC